MPVLAYLGRVLTPTGTAAGTCFQVSPGIVVTAHHVLDGDILVAPFDGGPPQPAEVIRQDPLHDLAVLRVRHPFAACVALSATDAEELTTPVVVTGTSQVSDRHIYGYLDAPGLWAGGTTRDGIPLGRLSSKDVVPGMSGAPVRRLHDDSVIGVVSGRYNSTDNWLRDFVWVARTEDLEPLLAGLADVKVAGRPLGPVVDLLLEVSETSVRLVGPGMDVTADHGGVGLGLRSALGEVRRAGQLLSESFLPEPLAQALTELLRQAQSRDLVVRIGVDAPEFSGLPWEALSSPLDDRPLALCRSVAVYRKATARELREIPGPLRIVVAIASPENGAPVLDYERELRNVLAAVRSARQGEAQVRVVPFATTAAIRAELVNGPAHVLHLSGHGKPGALLLEDEDGAAREVTGGQARFYDITERLLNAVGQDALRPTPTLDAALAESITLAANDILLDQLLATLQPAAERLLMDLSVYREPVETPGDLKLLEATSLVTVYDDGRAFVHRWTASQLASRWTAQRRDDELRAAHRQAAQHWQHPDADIHDLLEARHHLVAAGDFDDAGALTDRVCETLHQIGAFDHELDLIHESLRWLKPDTRHTWALVRNLGDISVQRGEYVEADQRLHQALEIAKRLGEQHGLAASHHQLGVLAQTQGALVEAERHFRHTLEIAKRIGDQAGMAATYHHLSMLAYQNGDFTEAKRLGLQALEINERLGNQGGIGNNYHQLGAVAYAHGDNRKAENRFRQALEIAEQLGDQVSIASCNHNLGLPAKDRGDYMQAERRLRQAIEIRKQLGTLASMADTYHELGALALDQRDYTEAERCFSESLKINMQLGNHADVASTSSQLGVVANARGELATAVVWSTNAYVRELEQGAPPAGPNIGRLLWLRLQMGGAAFDDAAGTVANDQQIVDLNDLLDLVLASIEGRQEG